MLWGLGQWYACPCMPVNVPNHCGALHRGVMKAILLRENLMQRSLIPGWIWHFPHGIAVRVRGIVAANQVVSTIGGI